MNWLRSTCPRRWCHKGAKGHLKHDCVSSQLFLVYAGTKSGNLAGLLPAPRTSRCRLYPTHASMYGERGALSHQTSWVTKTTPYYISFYPIEDADSSAHRRLTLYYISLWGKHEPAAPSAVTARTTAPLPSGLRAAPHQHIVATPPRFRTPHYHRYQRAYATSAYARIRTTEIARVDYVFLKKVKMWKYEPHCLYWLVYTFRINDIHQSLLLTFHIFTVSELTQEL